MLEEYVENELSKSYRPTKGLKRYPIARSLWVNQELLDILDHNTKQAKLNGHISPHEPFQSYVRNLIMRDYLGCFDHKRAVDNR